MVRGYFLGVALLFAVMLRAFPVFNEMMMQEDKTIVMSTSKSASVQLSIKTRFAFISPTGEVKFFWDEEARNNDDGSQKKKKGQELLLLSKNKEETTTEGKDGHGSLQKKTPQP